MPSSYPGGLDSLTNPAGSDSMATVSHASQHANANDAIEAIQAELGTDPSGASASVAARFGTVVVGPGSATDNAVVRFDLATGKLVQSSGVVVDDSNNVTGVVGLTATGRVTAGSGASSGYANGSTLTLVGTGAPEGVVTAPVGSLWTDINATTGAIQWIKASGTGNTGWMVEYGDTGTRNMASLLTSNATATIGAVHLRRIGVTCYLGLRIANSTLNTAHELLATLPSGFRPKIAIGAWAAADTASSTAIGIIGVDPPNGRVTYRVTDGNYKHATVVWNTDDAWPSSLPGSAA